MEALERSVAFIPTYILFTSVVGRAREVTRYVTTHRFIR